MNTTSQTSSFNLASYLDVIRYYVELILRRWPIIVAAGLIAGILMFLWRSLSPATYTSRSDVVMLIVRTTYEPAENNTDPQMSSRDSVVPDYLDDSRWTGLVALASNPTILSELKDEAYAEFEAQLVENDIERRNFGLVTDVAQRGDVLRLSVTYRNPAIATWAANHWADKFVEYANRTYITTGETPEVVSQFVDQAFQDYTSASSALAEYQLENQLEEVERQFESLDTLMTAYEERQDDIFLLLNASKVNYSDSAPRQESIALIEAIGDVNSERVNSATSNILGLYAKLETLHALKTELTLIQGQLESGIDVDALNSGAYLALMIARANNQLTTIDTTNSDKSSINVYGSGNVQYDTSGEVSTGPSLALNIDVTGLEETQLTIESVTALLNSIDEQKAITEVEIEEQLATWIAGDSSDFTAETTTLIHKQVNRLLNPSELILPEDALIADSQLTQNMTTLDEKLKSLEIQRNQLRLEQSLLYAEREAARNQYNLLLEKFNEVSVFNALGNTQVRRAPFLAVPPEEANPRGRARSAVVSAVAVSSLATLAIVAWDGWFKGNVNQSATTKSNKGTGQSQPS